ncbi:MAG TPA: hypothetical protein PLC04_01870 [Candidatus Kapabacteria bacterium]|jgi:tetratricopeptide (TPR) repeat protein|nr:hypothetical protein [Candidatus Kapabacteria bacterium]HOV91813.1 hypothetical protein [Candidatus Kapabacteria bacterium]
METASYWFGVYKQFLNELKIPEAQEALNKALLIEPKNIEILLERSDLNFKLQDFQAAIDDLQNILKIDPANETALIKVKFIEDILYMIRTDIFESTNLYEPPNSIFNDGNQRFR